MVYFIIFVAGCIAGGLWMAPAPFQFSQWLRTALFAAAFLLAYLILRRVLSAQELGGFDWLAQGAYALACGLALSTGIAVAASVRQLRARSTSAR